MLLAPCIKYKFCLMFVESAGYKCSKGPNDTVVLYPTGLKATFHELNYTGRFYANISWDPLRSK